MQKAIRDTYHIGDARKIPEILPKREFVDVTITSPPYWKLKDYGSKDQIGFGQEYDEYLDDLGRIFAAVHQITKKTGSLWIVADTIKWNGELKLFPFDLAQRLRKIGWSLHDIIVWHKDKTLPWSHRGKLRNIFEYILFFSKGKRFKYYLSQVRETDGLKDWWIRYPERYSPQGKAPTRTWSIAIPRQGSWGENWVRHFCPFPPDLVRRIVLLATREGDVVLDPFCGSGVVLAEAKVLKRHYVGLDLRKSYRRMFEKKVLPSLLRLEANNSKDSLEEGKKRKIFSRRIWRLRKTKYPCELLRLYEKRYGRTGIVGVLALSRKMHSLNVVFLFAKGKRPPKRFLSRLEKLMRQPPLSKYGLQVRTKAYRVEVSSKTFLRNGFHPHETLSLYRDGKTYRVSGQVTTEEFLESLRDGKGRKIKDVPPLASNIRVSPSRK